MDIHLDYVLDVAGAQRLETDLEKIHAGEGVTINLSAVDFVASSGLRVLLKHAQRFDVGGSKLTVSQANPTVAEVFRMSGFDQIIDVQ